MCSDKLDVDDHYIAWRQTHDAPGAEYQDGDGPFSFCSYPFLLNPRAKSKLLHTEARIMMNHTVQQVRVGSACIMKWIIAPPFSDYNYLHTLIVLGVGVNAHRNA